jgi:hypothetical protein
LRSETQEDAIEDGGGWDCSEIEKFRSEEDAINQRSTGADRSEIHHRRMQLMIGDPPEKDAIDQRSTGEGLTVGLIGDGGDRDPPELETEEDTSIGDGGRRGRTEEVMVEETRNCENCK